MQLLSVVWFLRVWKDRHFSTGRSLQSPYHRGKGWCSYGMAASQDVTLSKVLLSST